MKYVIWGAGHRGKVLYDVLGDEKVTAFIDSDPKKKGTKYLGCQVTDFDGYLAQYRQYPVIISIVFGGDVHKQMEPYHILYFSVEDCPPEFMGYGLTKAKPYMEQWQLQVDNHTKIVLYGCTLFTMLVYEKLREQGCMSVEIVIPTDAAAAEGKKLQDYYEGIVITTFDRMSAEILYITDKRYYEETVEISVPVIDIVDWTGRIPEYRNERIREIRKDFHVKRCFIVATGPSLTLDDLNILHRNREFTISINSVYKCFPDTQWRPDCYVLLDAQGIRDWNKDFEKLKDVSYHFIADSQPYFDYNSLDESWYIYHSILDSYSIRNMCFSDDFSKSAYNGTSVVYVCLQLAMYLGIKEIYLMGVDFSYAKGRQNHFVKQMEADEVFDGMSLQNKILGMSYRAFQRAKEYATENDVKIFNATRGGYLDVFERVDFNSLFN